MTEIATIDCFGSGGHLFSLKTLLYNIVKIVQILSEVGICDAL